MIYLRRVHRSMRYLLTVLKYETSYLKDIALCMLCYLLISWRLSELNWRPFYCS